MQFYLLAILLFFRTIHTTDNWTELLHQDWSWNRCNENEIIYFFAVKGCFLFAGQRNKKSAECRCLWCKKLVRYIFYKTTKHTKSTKNKISKKTLCSLGALWLKMALLTTPQSRSPSPHPASPQYWSVVRVGILTTDSCTRKCLLPVCLP